MKHSEQQKQEALAKLRECLKPGMTVHTVLRHCSRSGMSRSISAFAFLPGENSPTDLDYFASRALGDSIDSKHGGIRMGGCGMDMGFALVYNLSSVLFPNGFGCIGDGNGYEGTNICCPSNDHSNGDRDYTPHAIQYTPETCPGRPCGACCDHKSGPGKEHWHSSGGYALRHRWM